MTIRRLAGAALLSTVLGLVLLESAPTVARVAVPLDPAYGSNTVSTLPSLVVGAHRNGGLEFPESTYAGSVNALAAGVRLLDYDVRMLRDHTPVVLHDHELRRLTTSEGDVSTLTLPAFSRLVLDPADWFGTGYGAEHPMTTAQLLDRFKDRAVLLMELKDAIALPTLTAQIESRGMVDQIIVQSNSPTTVRLIHDAGLHAQLWRSLTQVATDHPNDYRAYGAESVQIDPRSSAEMVARTATSGLPVWAYGVNTPTRFSRLRALGVTGLISDAPLYASGTSAIAPRRPAATVASSTVVRRHHTHPLHVRVMAPAVGYPVPGARVAVTIGRERFYGTTDTAGLATITVRSSAAVGRYPVYTTVSTTTVRNSGSMLDQLTVTGSTRIVGARAYVRVTR